MTENKIFPKGFLWGAAASAPQTEGHSLLNGKSPSTWDKWFELEPERFYNNQGPENTSNTYELYKEDALRMKELGMNSYRTSIAWTRLLPDGKTLNSEAVDFYRSYFQELINNGVTPIINLFHFDMPWWLMEKGGWEDRESIDHFAYYAKVAFENFGDLVKDWTTFNEPMVHIECGYLYQYHYPAIVDFKKAVQVGYHTLMAHVRAVEEFKKINIKNGRIGIILNISPAYARSNSIEDIEAKENADYLFTKSFLDPCVLGVIPPKLITLLEKHELIPEISEGDSLLIQQNKVDFVGLNYYQPRRVKATCKPKTPAITPENLFESYDWPDKKINPYRGWEIYPQAIYDVALMMMNDYGNIPWYVSENGMGVADEERYIVDGHLDDQYRIEFIKEHLEWIHKAIKEGSSCFGYHMWTFVDCWSWLNGYRNRYGFYRVDLDNQYERMKKKSATWFEEVIKSNAI